jgi:hypothetical protein
MPDGGAADTHLAQAKPPREEIIAAMQPGDNESGDDEEKSGKVVTLDRFRNK